MAPSPPTGGQPAGMWGGSDKDLGHGGKMSSPVVAVKFAGKT